LEVSVQLHAPVALTPVKAPGNKWIGNWVGPKASLDVMEKWKFLTLPGFELVPCSQSLYRLRYRDYYSDVNYKKSSGFSPRANYTERPPLVREVSANFCG
jgi:hypothetical protein